MSLRQVVAEATHVAPHVIVVTVAGPDGTTSSETVTLSTDITASARRQAEAAWGDTDIEVDVRTSTPPWLAEGDLVRLAQGALDPDDGSEPYGQIVGFVVVGGVLVVQARVGAGIFAPEDLTVVSPEDIDPKTLEEIKDRAGPLPSGAP